MSRHFDEETLSRFLDGDLPADERAEIDAALEADPTLVERLSALEAQDHAIREWFDAQLTEAPAALTESVRNSFAERRAHGGGGPGWGHWWLPSAAAAAVVAVGLGAFDYMLDRRVDRALDQMRAERASDMALLASAMQEVLETRESGVEVSYTNSSTGFGVTLIPRRTWKSASGHWCREFIEVFEGTGRDIAPTSVACRDPEGQWRRVTTKVPSPFLPLHRDNLGLEKL